MSHPIKLDSVIAYHVSIPMSRPFRISVGELKTKDFVVLEGRSGDITGWGEVAVDSIPFYTSETVDTALMLSKRVFGPLIRSRQWQTPAEFADAAAVYRGHGFTKAAFESMLWDIQGKMTGKSAAALLCGSESPREWVETGPSLGIHDDPEALVEEVEEALQKGFRRIKIKVMPGRDVTHLEAVRRRFEDIVLMVDANAGYRPEDMDHLATWDRFGLLMIEQPLPTDDLWYHRRLAARMQTPICLDESAESLHLVACALEMQAADVINIKVGRVGGLQTTRQIHDLCAQSGIPVWIGSRIGSAIANSVRIAAASLPNATYPTDASFSSRYLTDDLVEEPFEIRDGRWIRVPDGPGLGIVVDPKRLERYSVRSLEV